MSDAPRRPTRLIVLFGILLALLASSAFLTDGFSGEPGVALLLLCLSVPAIAFRIWRSTRPPS